MEREVEKFCTEEVKTYDDAVKTMMMIKKSSSFLFMYMFYQSEGRRIEQ